MPVKLRELEGGQKWRLACGCTWVRDWDRDGDRGMPHSFLIAPGERCLQHDGLIHGRPIGFRGWGSWDEEVEPLGDPIGHWRPSNYRDLADKVAIAARAAWLISMAEEASPGYARAAHNWMHWLSKRGGLRCKYDEPRNERTVVYENGWMHYDYLRPVTDIRAIKTDDFTITL